MEYITHTKYKGKDINGMKVLITRGKKLIRYGDFLFLDSTPICVYRSEVARQHFSDNKDGKGLLRGDFIHKIAYSDRRYQVGNWNQRFNEKQVELLCSDKWVKFLNTEHDVIIFNDSFFEADIDELKELYKELEDCANV